MKQLITLVLFIAFGTSALCAQSVYFTLNDKVVDDGATLTFKVKYDQITEEIMGDTNMWEEDQLNIKTSNSSNKITGIVEVLSNELNATLIWCGLTTDCIPIPGSNKLTKGPALIAVDMMKLEATNFTENNYGIIKTKATLRTGLESRTVYINFEYSENGGSGIHSANNNASVKVAANNLLYKFDRNANRQLNIYNVTGTLLRSEQLEAAEGSVVLNNLSKGIYIYEVKENGKRTVTHKCVIQ